MVAASGGTSSHSAANVAAATAASTSTTTVSTACVPELPPQREVARPVSNLGNTCYMNAVLQALAHAPELCMAMDCEPHTINCPIALENRRRRIAASQARAGSPSSSPEDAAYGGAGGGNEDSFRRKPARKLRRSSRKSPTNGVSANNNYNESGGTPPGNHNNHGNGFDGNGNGNGSYGNNNNNNDEEPHHAFCALCEMEWHLKEVHSTKDKDKAVAPSFFVSGFIEQVAPWFKLGQQEDSHEFLRLLIDAMQRSCKNARPSSSKDNVDMKNDESTSATTATTTTTSEPEDVEYPFQLFRGTVESCVTCDSCKASSSTLDPIEDIGLEVTPSLVASSGMSVAMSTRGSASSPAANTINSSSNSGSNLEALADVNSAFQRFARVENLDAGYKCEKCGKGGRATKQSRLASIPPILTLHLKRFRYGGDARGPAQTSLSANRRTKSSGSAKIEGHIKFEQFFDLKPYLTDALQAKHKNMFCRLFAVVVHSGKNSHSGHYIAYVRNINKNEWYKMDDARVTLASPDEVMQAEAYMLFYRVVDHPFAVHLKDLDRKLRQEREAVAARLAAAEAAKEEEEKADAVKAEAEKENLPVVAVAEQATKEPIHVKKDPADIKKELVPSPTKSAEKSKEQGSPAAATTKTQSSVVVDKSPPAYNTRKRGLPEFTDGKSWARAKTRLKSSQYASLRSAEEYINENVQFKPEFFKRLTEEGSKPNARTGHCPIQVITGDDVVGGFGKFRLGLKKTVHRIAIRYEKENGESFFNIPAGSSNSNPSSKSNLMDKFVAVGGSAADDDLVL